MRHSPPPSSIDRAWQGVSCLCSWSAISKYNAWVRSCSRKWQQQMWRRVRHLGLKLWWIGYARSVFIDSPHILNISNTEVFILERTKQVRHMQDAVASIVASHFEETSPSSKRAPSSSSKRAPPTSSKRGGDTDRTTKKMSRYQ